MAEGGPDPLKEAEKDPNFHMEVRNEVKEMMIEREWRKRQLLKAATQAEKQAAEEKKEIKVAREVEKKKEENWVEGREKRVGSWRNFVSGKGKKKKRKKLKAFKSGQKLEQRDGDRDYIKRYRNLLESILIYTSLSLSSSDVVIINHRIKTDKVKASAL
eukprot:jgi/Bigna1/86101/estExt_fgenesh1_pg.C_80085